MDKTTETFDQLCTRLAYYIMQDIARGTPAERIASNIAQQTLLWRRDQPRESRNG
jgi:hypothetical protein